jgi:hypothetical protein
MREIEQSLADIGVHIPTILLPRKGTDLTTWAVVACDQYTSQPEYWRRVEELVADAPSTLNVIFPEVYLEDEDAPQRIATIKATMRRYLQELLVAENPGFILVERQTPHGLRRGLVMAIDLESYDYHKGSKSLIRPTEDTIEERLPPRVAIRQEAAIELPHVMLLINDPQRTVIEPLLGARARLRQAYDFELMLEAGHITGYAVDDLELLRGIAGALHALASPTRFKETYGVDDEPLLFAVGDGNHSLATAKAVWEQLKLRAADPATLTGHPARYALVELVNLYDEGLTFEPIHRALFNVDGDTFFDALRADLDCSVHLAPSREAMHEQLGALLAEHGGQGVGFIKEGQYGLIHVPAPSANLDVATLQSFLDGFLAANPEVKIDYLHGEEVVDELGARPGTIGFYLSAMPKQELFRTVVLEGALPRKTFSMGEAYEKRFYLEARNLVSE